LLQRVTNTAAKKTGWELLVVAQAKARQDASRLQNAVVKSE